MANTITDKRKILIADFMHMVDKLPEKDLEHMFWIGQGIIFANTKKDEQTS